MTGNGKNGYEDEHWTCQRCTAKNHPIDKYCKECLNARTVSYPTITENLPIPEISNPFPKKEFANAQESNAAAHTPKRREQPPDVMLKMNDLGNSDQEVPTSSEIGIVGLPELPMTFELSDSKNSSLDSMRDLYDQGSPHEAAPGNEDETMDSNEFRLSPIAFPNEPDEPLSTGSPNTDEPVNMEDFRLPPLPGFQLDMPPASNSPVFPSARAITTSATAITNPHPASVEDLIEQSATGFKTSDFDVSNRSKRHNNIGSKIRDPVMPNEPLDLTAKQLKLPQTSLNQTKPLDVPKCVAKPGHDRGVLSSLPDLPQDNSTLGGSDQLEPAQTGIDWSLPYKNLDRIGLGTANPSIRPPGAMNLEQHGLEFHRLPVDLRGSVVPPSPKPPYPPGLSPPDGEGILDQAPITMTTPALTNHNLKKLKPVKSNRPMPYLGPPSGDPQQQLSTNEIISLYGHNDVESSHASERAPEVASVRSATVTVSTNPTVSQIDDPRFFDPFAPPPKVPHFNDEHFGDDSEPMQEETQNPATSSQGETAPTPASTTSIASGGARRKIPRTQPPTGSTQTTLYTGPSTSRRAPPPEPMVLDGDGTWPCPLCTFANRISAQYCEVCHEGRPPWYTGETMSPIISPSVTPAQSGERILQHGSRELKSKAFVDEWVCQACIRSNQPGQEVCPACGTPRPTGFAIPSAELPSLTEPKRTPSLVQQPDMPSTSRQRLDVVPVQASRPTTSRQQSLSENLSSLRASSVGSATSGSAVQSIAMEQVRKDQERSALEIFHSIIEYCRQADDKFVDDQFLPLQRSLQFPNASYDPHIANACWFRPPQINSGDPEDHFRNWTVFCAEGPAATDIQQGILGNCWFLSGLSVLVERPQLLRKIFVTSEYSKYGAYMIRLCKDGVWQTVIIDDLLPCSNRGELLYTQSKRKQLWVPLIEKALAKAHGCYEALQAGRSIEGLATLTGAPCESLQLVAGPDLIEPEPDMIWVRLLSAREAGYLMGASCGGANMDVDETIYNEVDLRVRHAYSVLDVRIEKMDNGEAVKLLQLRNPWAQQSWSGSWSDRDERWQYNPRMQSRLNPNQSNHGIFWLGFDDMLKYFDSVDICKIRDNKWSEIRTEGDFPDSAVLPPCSFFLEVFQSTEIDLSIFQQGSRSQEGSGRHPVDLCICVFRSSEHAATSPPGTEVVLGPLVVCSRRQVKRHGSCSHFFEPGVYQVVTLAFNHWMSAYGGSAFGGIGAAYGAAAAPAEHPKFVLALHSSRAISLSQFKAHPMLLADATIELVMKKGEKKDVRECSTCYYLTRGWAGLIVVAENRHPTRFMQIVCDCLDSRNVVSTRGSLKTADCVPPLHKQVIIVLTQLDGHSGFTITHKLVHRMGYEGLGDWSQKPGNHDPSLTPDVEALHKPRPL